MYVPPRAKNRHFRIQYRWGGVCSVGCRKIKSTRILADHLRWGCRCGKRPRGVEAPQTPSSAPMPRVVHRPPSAPAPRVPCCSARCVAVAIPMPSACFLLSEEYQNLREQSALNVPLTSIAASNSGEISLTDKVAAHARCSLSNQNDCNRCAGALFASAGSSE